MAVVSKAPGRHLPVAALVVGSLAGVLAGIDIILMCLLELMLKGAGGHEVHIPIVAHAEWNRSRGLEVVFQPGAVIIVVLCVAIGVALAWQIVRPSAAHDSEPEGAGGGEPGVPTDAEFDALAPRGLA